MIDHSSDETSILTLPNDKTIRLNTIKGTRGSQAIDVRDLYSQAQVFTYDPGFTSTASCASAITYVNGEKGELYYRGYEISDLANNSDFMEVSYLLLNGELPNKQKYDDFVKSITNYTMVHEQIISFYQGFSRNAHPMAVMIGIVGAIAAFYHDGLDINDPEKRRKATMRLIAKVPTIAAMTYKHSIGQPFVYPRNDLSYVENFLYMSFSTPCEEWVANPEVVKALDMIFTLHADHEQNASTSTVRIAGSSGANPFACIAAGIASLWGPAHGGANEAVLATLMKIETPDNISKFIERAKDKNDPFRLMGFGHRVYKNYDPRAAVLKKACKSVLNSMGIENDPLLTIAVKLEEIALNDPYFIDRNLYPNVDFYSGILLKAMGFSTNMFTVLFALARTVGWIAHWNEMIEDPLQKIGRPRQIYIGETKKPYVPMTNR